MIGRRGLIVAIIGAMGVMLSSCAPIGKAFRDTVTANGEAPDAEETQALKDDWKQFEIEEKPILDSNKNELDLPKILSRGEQWLPRTLLIRDLKVSWNADRSKIYTRGSAQWNNGSTKSTGDIPFSLAGNWSNSSGFSDLVMIKSEMPSLRTPKGEDVQVRGRVYCVGIDDNYECNETITEIYIRYGSIIYSGQYESVMNEDPNLNSTAKPKKDGDSHNHHDEDNNNGEEEFYNDAVPEDLDNSVEVANGTGVNEVEALFETDNIEKSNDKIEKTPILPAPPPSPEKNSLPKVVDLEVEQIINAVNEKNKNNPDVPFNSSPEATAGGAMNNQNEAPAPPTNSSTPPTIKPEPSLPATPAAPPSASSPTPPSQQPSSPKSPSMPPSLPHSTPPSLPPTPNPANSSSSSKAKDNSEVDDDDTDFFAAKSKGGVPIPRKKPSRKGKVEEGRKDGKGGTVPIPSPRPKNPDDDLDEEQNPDRPGVVIPRRKPTPPEAPKPPELPDNPIDDGQDSGGKVPENSLIGPFYAYQSYGYYHPLKGVKRGGLQNPSNLFQMVENIKKENLTNQFLVRSKSPTRVRSYGNFATMEFLLKSSYWVNKLRPGLSLEVNDISAQRGGHLGNHASHQNGLDMDVGYFFEGINENYYGRSALKGKGFDPKFDRALLWNYLKTMMTYYHDQVYMIFVHSSIKKAMCAEAKRVGDLGTSDKGTDPIVLNALRRLYPESGHHNHFHVRLRCPKWDDKKGKVNCVNPKSDLLEVTGCWGGAKGKR